MRILSLVLALAVLCSCAMLAHADNYTTYVRAETESGTIQGYNYDGVNAFLGVPYASAARFQMPQKVEPWEGVRLAMFVGDVAPANKTTTSGAEFITPSGVDNVENEATCLNLNIWTPSMEPGANLPVIFWIHGGGYSSGSSIELGYYWGYNLAATGEAVFVSIARINRIVHLHRRDAALVQDAAHRAGIAGRKIDVPDLSGRETERNQSFGNGAHVRFGNFQRAVRHAGEGNGGYAVKNSLKAGADRTGVADVKACVTAVVDAGKDVIRALVEQTVQRELDAVRRCAADAPRAADGNGKGLFPDRHFFKYGQLLAHAAALPVRRDDPDLAKL